MRTYTSQNFKDPSTPFLAPGLLRFVTVYIAIFEPELLHDAMAAVAKAQVCLKFIFCRSVGSNPGADRNMSIIFFIKAFFTFSL